MTDREPPSTLDQPDFSNCANCGAEAKQYVYWNQTGGWTCLECGEADYPEASE